MRDIDEIVLPNTSFEGKLYLGSINSLLYVPKLRIDLVISLCDLSEITIQLKRMLEQSNIKHVKYDIDDSIDSDTAVKMTYILQTTAPMIYRALLQGQNVLVHCYAGISRSASVVIHFVCQLYRIKFNDGFKLVQQCRSVVFPNWSFVGVLEMLNRH